MKLLDHVNKIKTLVTQSFVNEFQRIGVFADRRKDITDIPGILHKKRKRLDEIIESHISEVGSYEEAYIKIIDEYTFTLFNRIAAIKVMEAKKLFPEIITKRAENGNRSFQHRAWLEEKPEMKSTELEGLWEFIRDSFNKLSSSINLYSKNYTYALLPSVIELNNIIDEFNSVEADNDIDNNIWESDDVIGWLYESYTKNELKDFKDSDADIEYDKVSLSSQWYTPQWVVEFLENNSLGKLYLEMYPDSEIKNKYKIANPPQTRVRDPKHLHVLKLIDPACGSGNFLLYAFTLFYDLYMDQIDNFGADYEESDIPKLIIENNLYGIDLDDRAVQLAQLGLWIKAKEKNRSTNELRFNIVSSDFFLPEFETVLPIFESGVSEDYQLSIIEEVWTDLQHAYKFGSLIKLEEKLSIKLHGLVKSESITFFDAQVVNEYERFKKDLFVNLEKAISLYAKQKGNTFLTDKTKDSITFLKLITSKYDVATANPPYTDSADYGPELKTFIDTNYKNPQKFHTNLYATFIKRCYDISNDEAKIALVHPPTFMYIKTFEDVREFILDKSHIDLFVEWGYLGMFNNAARVDSAMYILEKKINTSNSFFIKLNDIYEGKRYEAFFNAYSNLLEGAENSNVYSISQSKLKIIKSYPFIYWISDDFRKKFNEKSIDEVLKVRQGIATGNNNRCLRFWWEVNEANISTLKGDNKKWVGYSKGGPYKKWYGNMWLLIDFSANGYNYLLNHGNHLPSKEFYFLEGLTYSASGSKGVSFRYFPQNHVFDVGGSCIFPHKFDDIPYALAFMNSKLCFYITECLNPTVNTQVGDLKRVPFVFPPIEKKSLISDLTNVNIKLMKKIYSFIIYERYYKSSPINADVCNDIRSSILSFINNENYLMTQLLINDSIINEKIFEIYALTEEDKKMVIEKEGPNIGSLPVVASAKEAFLANEIVEFPLQKIRLYINKLEEIDFDKIVKEQIVSEFSSLYHSNNGFEDLCLRHQVNPINVWYWFKKSNVLPKQRMNTIAMEFLVELIREILNEDEDGIAPLVRNAGEEILLDRIEKKFLEKGFTLAQYSSFPTILGKEINDYLFNNFFKELSDHLNLFQYLPKTPFIWHLTAGPLHGFECYIIIYKWSRDKLSTIKSVYVQDRESALRNRQSDLQNDNSAKAQNEKELIYHQLKEMKEFKQKIDELLSEGYNPILDDGVGKNIAPLQKKGLLAYDVLNKGQLKKYLNADW